MTKSILILGGYGNFGKRICETLSLHGDIRLIIAGRDIAKAKALCDKLRVQNARAELTALALDIFGADFAQRLVELKPFLVIHTSGPFQGQDYRVPRACIAAGAHYIDLADDRRFVCDISTLDTQAREKNILVVSGASSVPGLSSVVIDKLAPQFSRMDALDIAIAPGNRAERGEATVKAILSYTGHPIKVFENAKWTEKIGWMAPRKLNFGKVVGNRWLANVDVPDLELFPARYPQIKSVNFQAGLELPLLHWGMVSMAWLARYKIVRNWAPLVKPIITASNWFINLGTDVGGMRVKITGLDMHQQPLELVWQLTATGGVGPYIPTLSAIILAEHLINGSNSDRGAQACVGLYQLEDFKAHAQRWGIYYQLFSNGEEQAIG